MCLDIGHANLCEQTRNDFILGVGKSDKRVIFLLDIGRVLSAEDATAVSQAATS